MKRSPTLANVKHTMMRVAAATTVLVIMTGMVPESAQALLLRGLRFSGTPNDDNTFFEFDIDISVPDSDPDPDIGLFEGAVLTPKYTCLEPSDFNCPDELPFSVTFDSEDLRATKVNSVDDIQDFANTADFIEDPNNFVGGIRYDSALFDPDTNSSLRFAFLLTPPVSGSINDLSTLGNFLTTSSDFNIGISLLNEPDTSKFDTLFTNFNFTPIVEPTTDVPEPASMIALLGFGALGTMSMLKRSRSSTNRLESRIK
jgi:PEP-CTERM motif